MYVPAHIIGDPAYPLRSWLMKAYPEANITEIQSQFNKRLSSTRMSIERAFGRLKGRWRILLKRCDVKINHMNDIICACIILHNLCIDYNCIYEDGENEFYNDNIQLDREDGQVNEELSNKLIRDALCNLH